MDLNLSDLEQRYIITPSGKGWMMGFDTLCTVIVHFSGEGAGWNKGYKSSECEELPEYVAPADRRNQRAG
jgi:hypothetical protein